MWTIGDPKHNTKNPTVAGLFGRQFFISDRPIQGHANLLRLFLSPDPAVVFGFAVPISIPECEFDSKSRKGKGLT